MTSTAFNTTEAKKLVQAILSLETSSEAERFLADLLTPGEIEEFSKRFLAAELLSKGYKYSAIEERTGFSSTTVARVSWWLQNGKGYKDVLKKLHHHWSAPKAGRKRVALMN